MGEVGVPHDCTWCDKQEKLLIKWAEKAAGYRWLHNHSRLYFKKQNDYLSYPSIIIASITGVGGFAVLNPSGRENVSTETHTRIVLIQYFFAFLNVMGGILTSISKFSQSSTLIESHSLMCVQWSKFYRNIDMELSLDVKHRANVYEFVVKAREDYDRLLSDAPDIPAISIRAFNRAFPEKENKPDVCNGLSIIETDDKSPIPNPTKTISKWLGSLTRAKSTRKSMDLTEIS
jgi:hypothetical protein